MKVDDVNETQEMGFLKMKIFRPVKSNKRLTYILFLLI